jgi:hypothetical protein
MRTSRAGTALDTNTHFPVNHQSGISEVYDQGLVLVPFVRGDRAALDIVV